MDGLGIGFDLLDLPELGLVATQYLADDDSKIFGHQFHHMLPILNIHSQIFIHQS